MDLEINNSTVSKFYVLNVFLICNCRSTTWKNILAQNSGGLDTTIDKYIHGKHMLKEYNLVHLDEYNKTQILHILDNYFKFLVVRHPLDRLVSTYRDKFLIGNQAYQENTGSRILREFRPGADKETIRLGKGVTFKELVQFVIKHVSTEEHIYEMNRQCFPCQIQYDYIAKLETHTVDAAYIIKNKLSGKGADALYNVHHTGEGATVDKDLLNYKNISTEELEELKYVYSEDFHMFGYTMEVDRTRDIYRTHCNTGSSFGNCC